MTNSDVIMTNDEPIINRLIIVGNGFDLAHGLDSKYSDFIKYYLVKSIKTFFEDFKHDDPLLEIKIKDNSMRVIAFETNIENVIDVFENLRDQRNKYTINFKSNILQKSYANLKNYNWVDLETDYFQTLNTELYQNHREGVQKVNIEFEFIKETFLNYLQEIHKICKPIFSRDYHGFFTENIIAEEIISIEAESIVRPNKILFLNFNYTNILENYTGKVSQQFDTELNCIHGNLDNYSGEPIFGYGDEFNKKYLEFEDNVNYKDLVKHIKSFEYSKVENYYNLIRFIESGNYQIQIFGHSCGLSDRTLLSQIFEHKHCLSIKVFYHKKSLTENDFTEKSYEIARHFKDKIMFRKKLVPQTLSKAMPQIKIDKK